MKRRGAPYLALNAGDQRAGQAPPDAPHIGCLANNPSV